ncbi:class 1 fructose-bisphosphatase [Candidatus Nanohalobium constans]|uniref:fructose-bisphosphatase n=1 Tax=Candidatus Nanohalobium constans TaxID=2565781 RepID=A0A5Q0UET4_9ARCH|nr:class 1 fructose-bisphosphatase [Candidatus Nanohalobium constans]QGA80058.1 fructose-1,6-bisphosphatase I [Candidatus Nanohalobium constans]
MDKQEVVDEVFHSVAEVAPHISSGLLKRREYVGEENPSDEKQLEADVWANEFLKEEITSLEGVGEFASEEEHEVTDCGEGLSVTVDPLDGSSNIPTNNIVGTIVGIYDEELPCRGKNIVAAFYVVYGPLTSFTIARDGQVDEYVLEESKGDGVELHKASEDIQIPEPYVYGFGGNKHWGSDFERLKEDISDDLKLRYGGAMVGDVNQVLHQGGVFGYPAREDAENGKLRLLFEANPMAYIFETAGGKSSDGDKSILRVKAEELHQRTPVFVGSEESVRKVNERGLSLH